MARHLSSDAAESPIGHNATARKENIVSVIKRLAVLDEEIRSLSQARNEIKQKEVKGDLGMKISDFNIARRVYLLEGDDRRQMLATMRETFDALGIGEQLDFITAMSPVNGHARA